MSTNITRRSSLGLVSSCIIFGGGCIFPGPPDIEIFNNTGEAIEVSITIIRQGEGEIFSDTTEIEEESKKEYDIPRRQEGEHVIEIDVKEGPSDQFKWDVPTDEAEGVAVHISADEISFSRYIF